MTGYEFIFSSRPVKRLYRYSLFWLVLVIHFIIQNLITGGNVHEALSSRSLLDSAFNAIFFFPIYILSVYFFIKILLPLYFFRHRYILFLILVTGLIISDFAACYFSGVLYLHFILQIPFDKITFSNNRYNAIVNGLFLPIVILGITGGIKLAKKWYQEQQQTERLAREKISKELQLLKNQLHPRFLFYSLRTVTRHIEPHPLLAANLILQLSDLLSYILYESDREWVLLDKEIEIIKSYLELQKKSSNNKFDSETNISGETSGKYISPLLLLSFIENAFDFLLKESQNNPYLQLYISAEHTHLDYQFCCTHFSDKLLSTSDIKKIFVNSERQLLSIYPGMHQFEILCNAESITIKLRVTLHDNIMNSGEKPAIQNEVHAFL
jgi:two-component system, LytTR family, sensor kinase